MSKNKIKTTIVISKDEIDNYETEVDAFLKKIFNIDRALYTDITEICDFSFSGLTPEQMDVIKPLEYKDMLTLWDEIILQKIQNEYHIKLNTTQYLLLDLIKDIENQNHKKPH